MQPQNPNDPTTYQQPPVSPQGAVPVQPQAVPPMAPSSPDQAPQPMYYTRPMDPQQPVLSAEVRQRHEESKQKYPKLNLSDGEYVISDVRRHPIGLIQIWGIVVLAVLGILGLMAMIMSSARETNLAIPSGVLAIAALLLCSLVVIGGYIGAYVYSANRFYLTNESVIQNIQHSLFSNREQTVSLANIEDASYTKKGIIQAMFNYGMIRLSTQGDETTYRFPYAAEPQKQVSILNNAVEAFKNGRPVSH